MKSINYSLKTLAFMMFIVLFSACSVNQSTDTERLTLPESTANYDGDLSMIPEMDENTPVANVTYTLGDLILTSNGKELQHVAGKYIRFGNEYSFYKPSQSWKPALSMTRKSELYFYLRGDSIHFHVYLNELPASGLITKNEIQKIKVVTHTGSSTVFDVTPPSLEDEYISSARPFTTYTNANGDSFTFEYLPGTIPGSVYEGVTTVGSYREVRGGKASSGKYTTNSVSGYQLMPLKFKTKKEVFHEAVYWPCGAIRIEAYTNIQDVFISANVKQMRGYGEYYYLLAEEGGSKYPVPVFVKFEGDNMAMVRDRIRYHNPLNGGTIAYYSHPLPNPSDLIKIDNEEVYTMIRYKE